MDRGNAIGGIVTAYVTAGYHVTLILAMLEAGGAGAAVAARDKVEGTASAGNLAGPRCTSGTGRRDGHSGGGPGRQRGNHAEQVALALWRGRPLQPSFVVGVALHIFPLRACPSHTPPKAAEAPLKQGGLAKKGKWLNESRLRGHGARAGNVAPQWRRRLLGSGRLQRPGKQ
jgi:hypothetical protein